MAHLTIATLGPLAIERDGVPVDGFEYNKVRALLVYLAIEAGRPHARRSLADLLWPDLPERAARGNLSQALSTLRRALGEREGAAPLLEADPERVRIAPGAGVEVDAARFLDEIAACDAHPHRSWRTCSACVTRLSGAAARVRGDFLEDLEVAGAAPFEEWAMTRREHLRARAIGVLDRLVEAAEWRGAYAEAAALAWRMIDLEPLLESGHRELMRQLALNGEAAAALAHLDSFRRRLEEEVGAAPEPATEALADRIRDGAGAQLRRHPPPPLRAPAPPTPLIGREAELGAVQDQLRGDVVRALTLTGVGGVGKTRLALETARALRYDFEDGVHVVELAALDDATLVPATVARALGVRERAGDGLEAALAGYLHDKHLLLVLDNAEHLLSDGAGGGLAAFAARLLAAGPAIKELVTSRAPLRIKAEHLHPLAPLSPAEAVALFRARARAARPGFQAANGDMGAMEAICQRLDGLPLAIELIAARAGQATPAELLSDLERSLDALGDGPRDAPARQRSFEAAIAWSVDRLDAAARRAFDHLGAFALGGSETAFGSVVASDSAVASFEALAEASLVAIETVDGERRFRALETLRSVAAARLVAAGEEAAARRRHAAYYLALALQAREALDGAEQAAWLDRLERDHDNLRLALAWWTAAAEDESLRLATALAPFWEVRSHPGEGRRRLADALASRPDAPAELRAPALDAAGLLAWRQGDYAAAGAHHEAALALWLELEDEAGLARTLRRLGGVAWDLGEDENAQRRYAESLAVAEAAGDEAAIAAARNNLGMVAAGRGDFVLAQENYEAARASFRALSDRSGEGNALLNLGLVAWDLDDVPAMHARFAEALAAFEAIGHRSGVALVRLNRGNAALEAGDVAAAATEYEASAALYRALGDHANASYGLFGLGEVAFARGDHAAARRLAVESLMLRHAAGERRPMPRNLEVIARLERLAGRVEQAARLLGAALALREALGTPPTRDVFADPAGEPAIARALLGARAFAAAEAEGRAMGLEAAVALARGGLGGEA